MLGYGLMTILHDRFIPTIYTLIALAVFTLSGNVLAQTDKLSPSLLQVNLTDGKVKVVAFLNPATQQAFRKSLATVGPVRAKSGHALLVTELQQVGAQPTAFDDFLKALADSGKVESIRKYWITDAVSFTVDRELLPTIAAQPDLHYLVEDQPLELVDPVESQSSSSGFAGSDNDMALTGVRTLWNKGYTGHGRLVCNFDTGVEGTHPALAANWLGANGGSESQSWFDPYGTTAPVDGNGHGTHTMGIMVGRDGADTIGVAFNAAWISAAVVDRGQNLGKTVSDILAAFQWAADPDGNPQTVDDLPDVVSNSWGIPRGLFPPCDQTFYQAIDNLEALGVVVIFACGNEGPNRGTIRNPADRTSSPTNSFSIGAVDQTQSDLPVAPFSSRGPATCDSTKIKPELMAPGVLIRSSYRGGGYKLMSGTSMAAPFVAGCVALMREYNPDATVEQIKSALIQSAGDLGVSGKDNDYGWGFINVSRALDYLPRPLKPRISIDGIRLAQADKGVLARGATTMLELSLVDSIAACTDLRGELRASDGHAFVLADTVTFGSISAGGTIDNYGNPFLVKLDHEVAPGTALNFAVDFYSRQLGYLNSANFTLTVDEPTLAATTNLSTGRFSFEATNFGVSRRLYDTSIGYSPLVNLSLMIADSLGAIYDALPGNLDYIAGDSLNREDFNGGSSVMAKFYTRDNAFSLTETATAFSSETEANFVLLDFKMREGLVASFQRCHLALGIDVDFSDGETVISDGGDFVFRSGSLNHFIGVRLLPRGQSFGQEVAGSAYKNGTLDDPQKYGLVIAGATSLSGSTGDNALVLSTSAQDIPAGGEIEMAAVIAIGNNIDEIRLALQRGEVRYNQVTGADGGTDGNLPEAFTLQQNYPNPFNAETAINFSLPKAGDYRFRIIDITGRTVKEMELRAAPAGMQTLTWDGKDQRGHDVATGVYFYQVSFGGSTQVRKMVLLK